MREIRRYQIPSELRIPKPAFRLLVQEVAQDLGFDLPFERAATRALQEATETHLTALFEHTNLCAIHAKRSKIRLEDMQLAQSIRELAGPLLPTVEAKSSDEADSSDEGSEDSAVDKVRDDSLLLRRKARQQQRLTK